MQLLIELEREIMLTQEWVLTPELDIVANGRTNEKFSEDSGLSTVEFSLRPGYEAKGNQVSAFHWACWQAGIWRDQAF